MLDYLKQNDFKSIVFKRLSPDCGSSEVKYWQVERNLIFSFNCSQCGYQTKRVR